MGFGLIETIINRHLIDNGGGAVYFLHRFTFYTTFKLNSKSKNGIVKIVSLRALWVIKLFVSKVNCNKVYIPPSIS